MHCLVDASNGTLHVLNHLLSGWRFHECLVVVVVVVVVVAAAAAATTMAVVAAAVERVG